jgi:chromosome segregation ATPase
MRLQKDESEKKISYLMDELNCYSHETDYNQIKSTNNEDSAIDENYSQNSQMQSKQQPIFTSHAEFITTKTVTIPSHENETIYCIESDSVNEFPIVITNKNGSNSTSPTAPERKKREQTQQNENKESLEEKFNKMVDLIVEKLKKEVKKDQENADLETKQPEAVQNTPPRNDQLIDNKYEKIAQEIFIRLSAQLEQTQKEKSTVESNLFTILNELKQNQSQNLPNKYENQLKYLSEQLDQAKNDKRQVENQLFEILGELKKYQNENVIQTAKYETQIKSLNEKLDQSNKEKAGIEAKLDSIFTELKHVQTGVNLGNSQKNPRRLNKDLSSVEKSDVESKLSHLLNEVKMYHDENLNLTSRHEQQIRSLNEQLERIRSEKVSIENQLGAILSELKRYQTENASLTAKHESQMSSLSEQLEKAKAERKSIENELLRILNEVKHGQSDLMNNTKQCATLNSELEQTKSEKTEVERKLLQLFSDLKQYQKENLWLSDMYEQQVKSLSSQLQAFQVWFC